MKSTKVKWELRKCSEKTEIESTTIAAIVEVATPTLEEIEVCSGVGKQGCDLYIHQAMSSGNVSDLDCLTRDFNLTDRSVEGDKE